MMMVPKEAKNSPKKIKNDDNCVRNRVGRSWWRTEPTQEKAGRVGVGQWVVVHVRVSVPRLRVGRVYSAKPQRVWGRPASLDTVLPGRKIVQGFRIRWFYVGVYPCPRKIIISRRRIGFPIRSIGHFAINGLTGSCLQASAAKPIRVPVMVQAAARVNRRRTCGQGNKCP